jgi:hypothetical protein
MYPHLPSFSRGLTVAVSMIVSFGSIDFLTIPGFKNLTQFFPMANSLQNSKRERNKNFLPYRFKKLGSSHFIKVTCSLATAIAPASGRVVFVVAGFSRFGDSGITTLLLQFGH